MKFIADMHIHSHFSVATSGTLMPENLEYWARLKGIDVVGTGDCIHPGWMAELREKLESAGNGLYRLRNDFRLDESKFLAGPGMQRDVCFMLTGEISNIYKKNGSVRKVHNLCVFPDFDAAEKVQSVLERMGNIRSDGRPILGLDSKFLLEMVLESSEQSFLVPAHIWTPWFSVLGSKSGFDTIDECYDDLSAHIFALETGLSSDPPMNRACSFLDRFTLVSNSDAHSPEKLGREANLFDTELSYGGIYRALRDRSGFRGTVEFFPEEGKYHYDGHRKCGVRWDPLETIRNRGICTKCGKPVTRGVMYRVAELADRDEPPGPGTGQDFYSITRLPELLAEMMRQKSGSSVRVMKEYFRLTGMIGPELYILLDAPLADIRESGGELLAEGVRRLREGDVIIDEGYDGDFGRITVFRDGEADAFSGSSLFDFGRTAGGAARGTKSSIRFDINEFKTLKNAAAGSSEGPKKRVIFDLPGDNPGQGPAAEAEMTPEQRAGIEHFDGPCMIIAGPGSGKTAILTRRIVHLVRERDVPSGHILAVTFTNRAAQEMRSRVQRLMPIAGLTIGTFHSFGLSIVRESPALFGRRPDFRIIDDDERMEILTALTGEAAAARRAAAGIEAVKQGMVPPEDAGDLFSRYNDHLAEMNGLEIGDLIYLPLELFRRDPETLKRYRDRYRWLLVDEFQDINAAQYEFLKFLAGSGSPNLFVIGDPDQAIYGFRGSDVRYMTGIAAEYPGMEMVRLGRSFRCPDMVMRAAGQVLGSVSAILGVPGDIRVNIQEMDSDRSEADWIAGTIERAMGGVRSFSRDSGITDGDAGPGVAGFRDFAVLCRSSFMFEPLQEAFGNHGVPCQVVGNDPVFRQEPYRSALESLKKIYYCAPRCALSQDVIEDVRLMIEKGDAAADVLKFLMVISEAADEAMAHLVAYAGQFGSDYPELFRDLALRKGADDRDDRAEAVSLMTIHASKGLEFDTVFIPGCERGIIPFELFGAKSPRERTEEERLLYVGITRTIKNLYLTHAGKREFRGRTLKQERSPFLDRIEEGILTRSKREGRKSKSNDIQLNLFK